MLACQPLVLSFHLHTKERQESCFFLWLLDQAVYLVLHTCRCLDASGCVAVTQEMLEKTTYFSFFFPLVCYFFFLTSLVIIGVALLLKTLISLREAATVVLASSCCGVPGNVLVKPVDQRCSKLVCMCGSIGIILQIMRKH